MTQRAKWKPREQWLWATQEAPAGGHFITSPSSSGSHMATNRWHADRERTTFHLPFWTGLYTCSGKTPIH